MPPPTRHALPVRPTTKKPTRPTAPPRRKRASTPEEGEIVEPPTGPASNVIVTQKPKSAPPTANTPAQKKKKKEAKAAQKAKTAGAKLESLKQLPSRPGAAPPAAALPTPPPTAPKLPLYSRAIQEEATQLVCELLRYGIPADYLFRLGATNPVIADSFESLGYRPRFTDIPQVEPTPIALPEPVTDSLSPSPDTPITPPVESVPIQVEVEEPKEMNAESFLNEAIVDLFGTAAQAPESLPLDDDIAPTRSSPVPVVPYVSHPPIRLSLEPLARRPTANEFLDTPATLSATRRSFRESSSVGTSSVIIDLSEDEQSEEEVELRLLPGESLDQLEAKERLREKEKEIERMMAKLVRMERKNKALATA